MTYIKEESELQMGEGKSALSPEETRLMPGRLPGRMVWRRSPARHSPVTPPALRLDLAANDATRRGYDMTKRILDIVGAALLLLLCFPLMLVIGLLVLTTSPGPVLFRQTRLGKHGERFWLYKFRTMAPDAEQQLTNRPELRLAYEESYKLADDPRVTTLGVFLRRSSLDELPQLFNILGGSMSLIGPRPIVPQELAKYGEQGSKLLSVKPGLGGHWQAHGRSDTTYDQRVALDMHYIDHRSLGTDLALLMQTALAAFRRRGSY